MDDRIIEGYLKSFSEENNLLTIDQPKVFEHFVNYCIASNYIYDNFSYEDINVGKGEDTGIDGIAIIAENHLIGSKKDVDFFIKTSGRLDVKFVFIQSKTSNKFDSAGLGNFGFGVKDFFKGKPSIKINDDIRRRRELKEYIYDLSLNMEKPPACHLYYATTGKWVSDENLTGRMNADIKELEKTSLFNEVKFFPIDSEKLKNIYRELKHKIAKEINFREHTILPTIKDVKEAYIGIIPGKDYLKFISDSDGNLQKNLFYDNLRDFQGYNPVNKDIANTLKDGIQKSRFGLLNNGITIVAKALNKVGPVFKVIDYQIVNGCQTSHVLHLNKNLVNDDVFIPIKIIVTDNINVTNDIIKATNWQTEVKKEALESILPFHKKLEEFYTTFDKDKGQRLYYERRSKQYEGQPIKTNLIVSLTTQIKSFLSMFLNEPHSTHRYYGELLYANKYRIFLENHSFYPYYTSSYALILLEDLFKTNEIDYKYRKFKFHILLLFRLKTGGKNLPPFNSKAMDPYCKKINDVLWNRTAALKVFQECIKEIDEVLKSVDNQYNITRLKKFTFQITELPDLNLAHGVVKYYKPYSGYGFIDIGEKEDVFVHINDVEIDGIETLIEGQNVEFVLKESDRGLKAEKVRIMS